MIFNSRSLCNKTFGVCEFLKQTVCDVCFITEAWIKVKDKSIIAEIKDMGYEIKFQPRKGSKRGGGVCVLFKPYLTIEKCFTQSYKTFEVLQSTIKSSNNLLRVSTFYRTGHMTTVGRSEFTSDLDSYLESLISLKGENILCGDLNVHVENLTELDTTELYDVTKKYGFSQLVEGPTHLEGGTLDLVFVQDGGNCNELIKHTLHVHDLCHSVTSDHSFIEFLVPFIKDPIKPTKEWRSIRNFKDIDIDQFGSDLKTSLESSDVDFFNLSLDDAVDALNDAITATLEKHAPLVQKYFAIKRTKFTTPEVLSLRRLRRKYEKRYRKYKKLSDKKMYENLIDDVRKCVKRSRNNCYRDDFAKHKDDKKKKFQLLNKVLGNENNSFLPDHTSEIELCNEFAEFFQDKVINIRNGILSASLGEFQNVQLPAQHTVKNTLDNFNMLCDDDVISILSSLSNKHCELDSVPTTLFKSCITYILPFLLYIANTSLGTGVFPMKFKTAIVRPTGKNSAADRNDKPNYRPVSNLSFLSKFLEKCVLKQLLLHLDENELFNKFQSAYRRFHSCETAMTKITNDIFENMDKNVNTFLVLLDLSAAFDLVDHSILLRRLQDHFSIHGTVIEWLKSYLSDRNYFVKINCSISNGIITLFGVPQGSILGPILFLLYIAEIEAIAQLYGLSIHIFADDMQLYISFRNSDALESISNIEHCLRHIKMWMATNFLKINEDKTNFLVISPSQNRNSIDDICISFSGSIVLPSSSAKNLGVKIDSSMSFQDQINSITSKGYQYLHNFYRVADKLTHDLKLQLVTSYILPLIDYCNVVLVSATKCYINKLQKLLNSAVRFIFNIRGKKRFISITPYLQKLHILPVHLRIKYKLCLLVYKCIHGLAPQYLCELLTAKVGYSSLRSSNDLFALEIKVPRTNYGESAFSYIAPYNWNELPSDIRLSTSVESFKSALKTYYFRQYFDV